MDLLKKYSNWILVTLLILSVIIILKQFFSSKSNYGNTIFKNDTTLITRYENEIKKDTVIKWYEKLVYKKSEPGTIYFQKTDTVFIEKISTYDLMLRVKKHDNKLLIEAINPEGKILKEYVYEDVYDNFSIISRQNSVFVKSAKLKWNGVSPLLNVQFPAFGENKKPDYQPGIETGINYKNKLDLNASLNYSFLNKQVFINSNLKIKF